MEDQSKGSQGDFTLTLPKEGNGPDTWTVHLKKISEEVYVAVSRLLRKEGKEIDAMKFLIRNLWVAGDDKEDVCRDWEAVFASAEQIMQLLPQAQGQLKKNLKSTRSKPIG